MVELWGYVLEGDLIILRYVVYDFDLRDANKQGSQQAFERNIHTFVRRDFASQEAFSLHYK